MSTADANGGKKKVHEHDFLTSFYVCHVVFAVFNAIKPVFAFFKMSYLWVTLGGK